MKKYLYLFICLLSFCFIGSVNAEKSKDYMTTPRFEFYISNPEGANAFEEYNRENTIIIPANERVTKAYLAYVSVDNTTRVKYGELEVIVDNSDIKPVNDVFEKEEGYELEEAVKFVVPVESGLEMYKGPSDIYYDKLDVVIPKDTEIEYKYIDVLTNASTDGKFAYVTYEGVSGWVYVSTNLENYDIGETEVISPEPIAPAPEKEESTNKHKPKKFEIVIVFSLGIILLLSLTSLVTLMLMNRNGSKQLDNVVKEEPVEEEEKTNKEE